MALTQTLESGLKVSNAPSDGKYLQYKDSTDKLTWATVSSGNPEKIELNNTKAEIVDVGSSKEALFITFEGETGTDDEVYSFSEGGFQQGQTDKICNHVVFGYTKWLRQGDAAGGDPLIRADSNGKIEVTAPYNAGNDDGAVWTFASYQDTHVSAANINASADSTYSLGTNAVRWTNVYADNLYGTLNGSDLTDDTVTEDKLDIHQAPADGKYLKYTSSNGMEWADVSAGTALTGSTNNTICTVTGANAIQGEAALTFDGNNLSQTVDADNEGFKQTAAGNHYIGNIANANITSAGYAVYIQTGQWNGNQIAQMRFIAGDDTTNKDDGDIAFYTSEGGSSSEVLRLTQEKNAELADGNLKVASGHGIDFSATSDATGKTSELLDDYEEGTWTPELTGTWTNETVQRGTYVRIGNFVCCTFMVAANTNTASANAAINGLPFQIAYASGEGRAGGAPAWCKGFDLDTGQMVMSGVGNATQLILYRLRDNSTALAIAWSACEDNVEFGGTFSYNIG